MERAYQFVDSVYQLRYPDDIITSFKSTKESAGSHVTYVDMQFKIDCPRATSEQALSQFLKIYTAYIERETSKGLEDSFELPRVHRRSETIIYDDSSTIYKEATTGNFQDENGAKANLDDANNFTTSLIPHESIVRVYDGPEEGLSLEIYKKLEKLTHCAIVIDEATNKITVKGDTTEDVEIVFAKLQIISDSYLQRTSRTCVVDLYVPENEINFKFHVGLPNKVIDRHILLEAPDFLSAFLEVNMVKWHSATQHFVPVRSRVTVIQKSEDSSHPWSLYVYPSLGSETHDRSPAETNLIRIHGHLAPSQVNTLTAWTENVPLETLNPFDAASVENTASVKTIPAKDLPQKEYIKSKRQVKGQPQAPTSTNNVDAPATMLPPPIEPPFMPATEQVLEYSDLATTTPTYIPTPTAPIKTIYRDRGDLIDHPEPVMVVPTKALPGKAVQQWANGPASINQQDEEYQQEQEQEQLRQLNLTQQALQPVVETLQSEQEQLQQLDLTQQALQPVIETLKSEQEISTRSYRRDRHLRAPRTTSSIVKVTSVVERITTAISCILDLARTAQGRITLQVALGHLYIPRRQDATNRTVDQSDWNSIFKGAGNAASKQTFFSSTLTTSWVDANFIVDLKLPSGTRMFNKTPAEVRVTYIIKCTNTYTKEDITVEVDQDGKHTFYIDPQSIGSISCHFPKRVWDARFEVTETAIADLSFQDPFRSVVDNLWVRTGSHVTLGGKTSNPEIKVTGILVHRQTSHPSSANPDLQLRLTEVQDLVLLRCPERQFQAYAAPEEDMIHDGNRIWWEASISSTAADEVLKENRTMELGEVAKWTLEDIVGMSIITDMFRLAEQVVTRIDNVGHGSNPVLVRQQASASRSVTKTSKSSHSEDYGGRWSSW